MSRSGYTDDYDDEGTGGLWRGAVASAIRGKRGQSFLRELLGALDAMPEKRLIADDLIREGAVCAIGSVGVARGIDMAKLDPDYPSDVAKAFGIAPALVQEMEFENDETLGWDAAAQRSVRFTPEQRWRHMRDWCETKLKATEPTP